MGKRGEGIGKGRSGIVREMVAHPGELQGREGEENSFG